MQKTLENVFQTLSRSKKKKTKKPQIIKDNSAN